MDTAESLSTPAINAKARRTPRYTKKTLLRVPLRPWRLRVHQFASYRLTAYSTRLSSQKCLKKRMDTAVGLFYRRGAEDAEFRRVFSCFPPRNSASSAPLRLSVYATCAANPRGIAASSFCVYSCFGARKIVSASACSTTSPSFITITSSAMKRTTARSWLMKM